MRLVAALFMLFTLSSGPLCLKSMGLDEAAPAPAELAALQGKAGRASPNDKCFLYAELVSRMTELANQQMNAGDLKKASKTLLMVQLYAEKVHSEIAEKSKKLKNAQLLLEKTCFRLKDIMNSASYDNRANLEATLKEVDQVQSELMLQVFKH